MLTPGAQITERANMKNDSAPKKLPRYVGYAEIEENFLIDRRTIQRFAGAHSRLSERIVQSIGDQHMPSLVRYAEWRPCLLDHDLGRYSARPE